MADMERMVVPVRHSADHFIREEDIHGAESIEIPNTLLRVAPGAEKILGSCAVGQPFAEGRMTIPAENAYSMLAGTPDEQLRKAGTVLLRGGAGRHHHRDLTLEPPNGFTTEYKPGTLKYGLDAIRHVVDKGMGLSAYNGATGTIEPRFWYFDAGLVHDAELSVRGLCGEKEATLDWDLVTKLNSLGGRFGIPLAMGKFSHLPAPRHQVEEGYQGPYQVKLYSVEQLRGSKLHKNLEYMMLPEFDDTQYSEYLLDEMNFGDPVYYKRGLVSGIRVGDLSRAPELDAARIQTTIKAIQREDASVVDEVSYLTWFAKACANNLALLHSQGLVHTQLDRQLINITLAAEIVDTSGARPPYGEGASGFHDFDKDIGDVVHPDDERGVMGAVNELLKACKDAGGKKLPQIHDLTRVFYTEYVARLEQMYSSMEQKPSAEPQWFTYAQVIKATKLGLGAPGANS